MNFEHKQLSKIAREIARQAHHILLNNQDILSEIRLTDMLEFINLSGSVIEFDDTAAIKLETYVANKKAECDLSLIKLSVTGEGWSYI